MRKILFKGKRKDNGEWVQGDLSQHKNGKKFIKCGSATSSYEVVPESVGQYVGLTDKNDNQVFEGDIVEGHCHSQWNHRLQRCAIVYDRDSFKSRHYLNYPNEEHYFEYKVLFSKDVVVIGNIHDNPELLKSE